MLYYDTEIIRSGLKKDLGKESDMLLKKESVKDIDYLQNWPEHYYEIETASKRKEYLEKALNQKLDSKEKRDYRRVHACMDDD